MRNALWRWIILGVDQLVRAPLMITLPSAYVIATVLWQVPDFWSQSTLGAIVSSLIASILVYLADAYTQQGLTRRDYGFRLIYLG